MQVELTSLRSVQKIIAQAQTAIMAETGVMARLCIVQDKSAISIAKLVEFVAQLFTTTPEAVKGKMRHKELVDIRRVATILAKKYLRATYVQIGNELHKDHATVMHLYRTGIELLETEDKIFTERYRDAEQSLLEQYRFIKTKTHEAKTKKG
jgi:chromosomal replication initiation ATPase DnaA